MKTFTALKVGVAPVALGLAMISTPVFAQDAADEGAEDSGTIVVTGTRIVSPNATSTAPITSIGAEDIKLSGATRAEDLLNSLPQVVAAQASTLANGATGTATVDLRGLGASRTLVLINGRRLMPGDPNDSTNGSAADLNFIPAALVKRVDVMTGGASATYGADAVSGVVNFIMDTDFTGFRVDGNFGFANHNNRSKIMPPILDARAALFRGYEYPKGNSTDGASYDGTVSFGANFDDGKGHFMAYVGYRRADALLQRKRDYSACTIQTTGAANGATQGLQCGGSSTSAIGTIFYFTANSSSSTLAGLGPGTLVGRQRYNFAPLNHFQRPDERYTAGAFADYEISEAIHPYMEFMFMDDRTVAQIAPSGDFGNTLTINCDNPLMSTAQRTAICNSGNLINGFVGNFPTAVNASYNPQPGAAPILFRDPLTGAGYNKAFMQLLRRNVEGGPRRNDLQHTAFRTVLGSRGDLGAAWSYDAYYQYGRTNYQQVYSNEFSQARLLNALDAVRAPNGQIVCRATLAGTDPNCAPYDIFTGAGPSAASLSYLSATGFMKGFTSQQVMSAQFNGALGEYGFKFPWASDGVNIAIGVEKRKDSLELQTDNAFSTGDLTGQGAPTKPVSGSYKVTELFGEVDIPVVNDAGIYNLSFNGAYRYSDYKVSNGQSYKTSTFKLSVDFAPVSDIRIRGGYNRAVRAPNIQELFAPQIVGLGGSSDPCAGAPITAAQTGCIAQGLRVGQNVTGNPAAQYNSLLGGTPNLRPEKATTKTLGVVLTPRWVPNLSVSVDWFDINIRNAIQRFGADAIVGECTNNRTPLACSLIRRNPAGSLWLSADGYTIDLQRNVGGVNTAGIEIGGNYSKEIGSAGRLSVNFSGTILDKYVTDNGLTAKYDCAGYYGPTCDVPLPKWRHVTRVTFQMPSGLGVSARWRHVGKAEIEYKNPSSTLNGGYYNFSSVLKPQDYLDLTFTANIGDHFNWRLGINNVLDNSPPLVHSGNAGGVSSNCAAVTCNGNTYPGLYDSLGRYIYTGITLDF